jgi:predicted acyltransferase
MARKTATGRGELIRHALRRAALIFGLGILLNGFPFFELGTIRLLGVLQRIALLGRHAYRRKES